MKQAAAVVAAPLLLVAAIAPHAQAPRPAAPAAAIKPKLVVLISVDQMRGDYIDRFRHQWTKGLHRLVTDGAWFRQADYPYYTTVTCAGHASIGTGTVPAVHGMVPNPWCGRRTTAGLVSCTDDETQKLITYGVPVTGVGTQRGEPDVADARRRNALAGVAGAARGRHFAEGALGDQPVGPQARRGDLARRA